MLPKNVPSEIPYQLIALYIIVTINANRHQEKIFTGSSLKSSPPPLALSPRKEVFEWVS